MMLETNLELKNRDQHLTFIEHLCGIAVIFDTGKMKFLFMFGFGEFEFFSQIFPLCSSRPSVVQ